MSCNKPNFFLVGAAKSGTTSIANYLSQHPEIYISPVKEPKYFSCFENLFPHNGNGDSKVDQRVIHTIDEYEQLFKGSASYKVRGECSVDYLYYYEVANRIKKYSPEAKILIVLRNPVERAYSAYMHLVRDGRENLSFCEAIGAESERIKKNWEFFWYYVDVGKYYRQVQTYMNVFGENQVKIFLFDDFVRNTELFLKKIYDFLDVDHTVSVNFSKKHNVSGVPKYRTIFQLFNKSNIIKDNLKRLFPYVIRNKISEFVKKNNLSKIEIPKDMENFLQREFENEIEKLSSLMNKDFSEWRL